MDVSLRRRRLLQALGGTVALAPLAAAAQGRWPSRPITLVVPYSAGGLTDNLGRLMGQEIGKGLGQSVVVENRPGAGSLLAAAEVAKAAPDANTLMVVTSTTLGIAPALYKNNPFKISDLTGVAMIGNVTLLLITRPDFPADSVKGLVEALRANPGKYTYASPGSGTAHQLLIEMLKAEDHVQARHIPYKGSGQPLTDVMNGRVDFMFIDVAIGLPQVKAGKVKLLAVSGARRSSLLPDTPTLTETHPDIDLQVWQGIAAPDGTPADRVKRVHDIVNKALGTQEVREHLARVGVEPNPMTTEAFNAMIRKDAPRWAELVKVSGASVE